jgi:ribosome-associated protein
VAVDAALQRKAEQVRVLDMRGVTHLADFFLVCHGSNPRQVQAIAEAIEAGLRVAGARALHVEGRERGLWVLLDFGFLVAHVFQEASREFYGLEKLWSDAGDVTGELVASEGSRDA